LKGLSFNLLFVTNTHAHTNTHAVTHSLTHTETQLLPNSLLHHLLLHWPLPKANRKRKTKSNVTWSDTSNPIETELHEVSKVRVSFEFIESWIGYFIGESMLCRWLAWSLSEGC